MCIHESINKTVRKIQWQKGFRKIKFDDLLECFMCSMIINLFESHIMKSNIFNKLDFVEIKKKQTFAETWRSFGWDYLFSTIHRKRNISFLIFYCSDDKRMRMLFTTNSLTHHYIIWYILEKWSIRQIKKENATNHGDK